MLVLFFLQLAQTRFCGIYQCSSSALNADNQCIQQTGMTFNLMECSAKYYSYCPASNNDSFCQLPPVVSDINIAAPGEFCVFDRNCIDSICSNSTCQVLYEGSCTSSYQCGVGYYCPNATQAVCMPQIAIGGLCNANHECVNSGGCFNNKCTSYFTLAPDTQVTECNNGMNYLCQSGGCVTVNSNYFCAAPGKSAGSLPQMCGNDGDCLFTSGAQSYSTGCVCGYNGNAGSYCNLAPGDIWFGYYIGNLSTWVSTGINKCHTHRRFNMSCIEQNANTTLSVTINYLQQLVMNYPMIQGNDECVQAIYTNSYWEALLEYNKLGNPTKKSFAMVIALSGYILSMI